MYPISRGGEEEGFCETDIVVDDRRYQRLIVYGLIRHTGQALHYDHDFSGVGYWTVNPFVQSGTEN